MTWSELMLQNLGYETKTTFWDDFSIAEKFGEVAIEDTYKKAFDLYKDNVEYITELSLVLNHKCWFWYRKNDTLSILYQKLYEQHNDWCWDNLTGNDIEYYYRITD